MKEELESQLNEFWLQYQNNQMTKGDIVSIFLMLYHELFPVRNWLNYCPKRQHSSQQLNSFFVPKLCPLFAAHPFFKKVPAESLMGSVMNQSVFKNETLRSNLGLVHLYTHPETVLILDYIPTPMQILEMQVAGQRCVTLLRTSNWFGYTFDHKRNLRDFVIHDLEHIWQMFEKKQLTNSQVSFSRQLLELINAGSFDFLVNDKVFSSEFNYIISDMNTHPAHAYATLRSLVMRQKNSGKTGPSHKAEQETNTIMEHFDDLVT